MSDPISNDYSSVTALTEIQERRALRALAVLSDRAAPLEGALGFDELAEMLGLDGAANEVRAEKGLRASVPVPHAPTGQRDALNRPRPLSGAARAVPDSIPEGQHGHNGRCASGDHAWTPENIRATTGAPVKCRPCEHRRKWGVSSKKDAIGLTKCKCPGTGHILTPYTSDTTIVDARGTRSCRENINRKKRERRARANAKNAGTEAA